MKAMAVQVGDVMTRDVVSVTPDTPIKDAATMLAKRGISGLPVCDADGRVVGVLDWQQTCLPHPRQPRSVVQP